MIYKLGVWIITWINSLIIDEKNLRIWRILLFDYYFKKLFGKYISFINYTFSLILMFLIVSSINHIQLKSLNNNMN